MNDEIPPAKIRLIALDLDGTLLRSDRTVGARSIEALRAAHAAGVEIVLASGRMTAAMERTAEALEFDPIIVSYNGAAVRAKKSNGRDLLLHRPLSAAIARELYLFARAERLQVNYYLDDVIVVEDAPHLRPWIEMYRERTGSPFRCVPSLDPFLHRDPTKLLLVMEPGKREAAALHWSARLNERAIVLRTDPEYLEFLDPAATKGLALEFVAQTLNIERAAIMAMGDGENDVSMLRLAGWPVAVANAGSAARGAARAVTRNDHENDAVAEALERWVLR